MELCKCGCGREVARPKNSYIQYHYVPGGWNKGSTAGTDLRIKGHKSWNEGLTKNTDVRLFEISGNISLAKGGTGVARTNLDNQCGRHGVTVEQYNNMLEKQNGVCAICHNPETSVHMGTLRRLAIDHDHKTGKVRGLLCFNCNIMLGKAKDNVDILKAAISYVTGDRLSSTANNILFIPSKLLTIGKYKKFLPVVWCGVYNQNGLSSENKGLDTTSDKSV